MEKGTPPGIKTLLPELGDILGLDAGWLYERVRDLARWELIETLPGRGPGSGIVATPKATAMLLISLLASDKRQLGTDNAAILAKAPPQFGSGPAKCPVTGARTLLDALAAALASKEQVEKLNEIVVARDALVATMNWGRLRNRPFPVRFSKSENPQSAGFRVQAAIDGDSLIRIEGLIRIDSEASR